MCSTADAKSAASGGIVRENAKRVISSFNEHESSDRTNLPRTVSSTHRSAIWPALLRVTKGNKASITEASVNPAAATQRGTIPVREHPGQRSNKGRD